MKRKFICCLLLMGLLLPYGVCAKIQSKLESASEVVNGEKLRVSIHLEQTKSSEEIGVYRAILEYDESTFVGIDEDSFEAVNGWSDVFYNEETHSILLLNKFGSPAKEEIVKFDLKLKNNVNPAKTKLKLINQTVANENGDIVLDDVERFVDVDVQAANLGTFTNSSLTYGVPLVENPVRLYHIITLLVLEVVLAVVAVMFYKMAKRLINSAVVRKGLLCILVLVEIVAISALSTYDMFKGDLDGDNVVSEDDISVLAKHLVNQSMISKFKLESADLNGDGKVTPADLMLLLNKSNAKKIYEVKLANSVMESNGYEKGETVDLRFVADVNAQADIEYVVMGGEKKKVEKIEGNEYAVKIEIAEDAERRDYNISEVVLTNGKSAKVDYEADVHVLKDIPVLKGVSIKEEVANSGVKVALTIDDEDDAITKAEYELATKNGKVVESGKLSKGKNSLFLKLDNAVSYKLNFKIEYDRGANVGEYAGLIEEAYDLRIITDYKFKIDNFTLIQKGKETDKVDKNVQTNLIFMSSNVSGYVPRKLNINGKEYDVSNVGFGMFQVALPSEVLNGEELYVDKTTLANGKVFSIGETMHYTLLKNKPAISNVRVEETYEDELVRVKFDVTDADGALDRLKVQVNDAAGKLITETEIVDENYEIVFPGIWTDKYNVKVYADYVRASDVSVNGELIEDVTLDSLARVRLEEFKTNEFYPDKGAIVSFEYRVEVNHIMNLSRVVIDNVIYDAVKIGDDTYKVDVIVQNDAGLRTYTTKKLIFDDGSEFAINAEASVDVLKDYPILDNYSVVENEEEGSIDISFDILDLDSSFREGEIRLIDKETGDIVQKKNVILGKNKATFALKNAVKYEIAISVDGVLTSDIRSDPSIYDYANYLLYSNEYRLVSDYMLTIESIETRKDEEVSDEFGYAEDVNIDFDSSNVTEYIPIKLKLNGVYYDVIEKESGYRIILPGFHEAGKQTLRFESIVLSNHKEVAISGYKTLSVLKPVPYLREVESETDGETITLKANIVDEKEALIDVIGVVYDEDGNEIFRGTSIDGKFVFNKPSTNIYTVEVLVSYDLNVDGKNEETNIYRDVVLLKKRIDLENGEFDMTDAKDIYLYDKENDQRYDWISGGDACDPEKIGIRLVMSDSLIKSFDIEKFIVENDSLGIILEGDEWVKIGEKVTNYISLELEKNTKY